jgi:hypothetical protein
VGLHLVHDLVAAASVPLGVAAHLAAREPARAAAAAAAERAEEVPA